MYYIVPVLFGILIIAFLYELLLVSVSLYLWCRHTIVDFKASAISATTKIVVLDLLLFARLANNASNWSVYLLYRALPALIAFVWCQGSLPLTREDWRLRIRRVLPATATYVVLKIILTTFIKLSFRTVF